MAAFAKGKQMKTSASKFPRNALDALEKGKKQDAIRLVIAAQGGKSRRARQVVENYLDQHPRIRNRMDSAKAENALSGMSWLLILAFIGGALYFLL